MQLIGHINNQAVYQHTLTNSNGHSITICNYGATIFNWYGLNNKREPINIVVGLNNLEAYIKHDFYCGCVVGRFANRIKNGTFSLDNNTYTLATNNGANHLHGGIHGFNKAIFTILNYSQNQIILQHISPHLNEGYPGNLTLQVSYTLSNNNELQISYEATSSHNTIVNFTNHAYFNLSGHAQNIYDHNLFINADSILAYDETQIPTGEFVNINNTIFDFTNLKAIPQFNFDHNYVLNNSPENLKHAATVYNTTQGIALEVHTTEPGLQFYTGNFLNGTFTNTLNQPIVKHSAFCLETQHFPNAPNIAHFPSTILQANQKFASSTQYTFNIIE
jgi:aldose 1-epimerase